MSLRVCRVAFEQVIGPDRDRNLFALIDFDDWEACDLHHSNTLELGDALRWRVDFHADGADWITNTNAGEAQGGTSWLRHGM